MTLSGTEGHGAADFVALVEFFQGFEVGEFSGGLAVPLGRHGVEVVQINAVGSVGEPAQGQGAEEVPVAVAGGLDAAIDEAGGRGRSADEFIDRRLEGDKAAANDDDIDEAGFDPFVNVEADAPRVGQGRRDADGQL